MPSQPVEQSPWRSWTAPANDGGSAITGYKVYYAERGGTFALFDTVLGTSATVTGLDLGTNYDYLVAAVNALGNSATSNMVTERTLYLEDSFTGAAANAHNTTADSGQTRTTVTGRVDLDGSGLLVWADDGSSTTPSDMVYGNIIADMEIVGTGITIPVGGGIHIHFNSDVTLENGWAVNMVDANNLNLIRLVGGVQIIEASSSGTLTNGANCSLTITADGDSISVSGTDGLTTETIDYSVSGRAYKTQQAVGLSLSQGTKISKLIVQD